MKKLVVAISALFLAAGFTFAQNNTSPVLLMDEAVKNLANEIHVKLLEKRAERVVIGQFTFMDGVPPLSTYLVNQLIGELTNIPRRNYTVFSDNVADAQWIITGEIVQVADIIRVYSRLIRLSDRAIEASFYSNFQREGHINDMISQGENAGGGSSSIGRDSREPDSWEAPVIFTIGSSSNMPVMNRTLTENDEDFFLLVPTRDGRLTMETTGNIDTFMHFFNYDTGEELAMDDDSGQGLNARIVFNVRAGTRYLAIVRGYSPSITGAYGFRAFLVVREGASSWNNPISYEIGIGDDNIVTVNRNLQEGDEDFFLLVPDRTGRIVIETTGRIDTYLELYDAESEELLDENDDIDRQNTNARIRYNVNAGTRYIVKVRGFDGRVRGNYGFRAYFPSQGLLPPDEYEPDDEPSQAKLLIIGTPQTRTFHSSNDVDWIRFQVTSAGRYVINARGVNNNRLDTYIELFDANLNLIAEDDDGGDVLSARLSINLNVGTYYIKVWCLDDEPNQAYIISVTAQ
jgi:hypothetical protein